MWNSRSFDWLSTGEESEMKTKYVNLNTAEVVTSFMAVIKTSITDYVHFRVIPDWTRIGSPKYKRAFGYSAEW